MRGPFSPAGGMRVVCGWSAEACGWKNWAKNCAGPREDFLFCARVLFFIDSNFREFRGISSDLAVRGAPIPAVGLRVVCGGLRWSAGGLRVVCGALRGGGIRPKFRWSPEGFSLFRVGFISPDGNFLEFCGIFFRFCPAGRGVPHPYGRPAGGLRWSAGGLRIPAGGGIGPKFRWNPAGFSFFRVGFIFSRCEFSGILWNFFRFFPAGGGGRYPCGWAAVVCGWSAEPGGWQKLGQNFDGVRKEFLFPRWEAS